MTSLEQRNVWRFYTLATALAGVFIASTVVEVFARYVEQRLGLLWRDWLTRRFIDRYLAHRAYRRLAEDARIDNPDQRISEDVRTFTATTLSFLILLFNAVVTFIAFAGVLWSISPWLFLTAVVYATGGSVGTVLVGRRLVALNNLQLKKEADFRYALGRVREHAGTVAQLGGEEAEKTRLGGRLGALVANFRGIIDVSRNLGFFTTLYNYLPQIIPALLVAPLFVWGNIPFGTVTQSAMAFSQLLGAFSLIVTQFQDLSSFAAVVARLGAVGGDGTPAGPADADGRGPPDPAPDRPVRPGRGGRARRAARGLPGRDAVDAARTSPSGARSQTGRCRRPAGDRDGTERVRQDGPAPGGGRDVGAGQGRVVRPGPGQVRFVPQQPYARRGACGRHYAMAFAVTAYPTSACGTCCGKWAWWRSSRRKEDWTPKETGPTCCPGANNGRWRSPVCCWPTRVSRSWTTRPGRWKRRASSVSTRRWRPARSPTSAWAARSPAAVPRPAPGTARRRQLEGRAGRAAGRRGDQRRGRRQGSRPSVTPYNGSSSSSTSSIMRNGSGSRPRDWSRCTACSRVATWGCDRMRSYMAI